MHIHDRKSERLSTQHIWHARIEYTTHGAGVHVLLSMSWPLQKPAIIPQHLRPQESLRIPGEPMSVR